MGFKGVYIAPMCFRNDSHRSLQIHVCGLCFTHMSLASLLWDIGKQNSPRCDAAERGVPSGAILFA